MAKKQETSMKQAKSMLHIVMYPWYGLSPLTSFLRVANKLANCGHKISFILPSKAQPKLSPHNHRPNLITFIPITVPSVPGLPPGAETPRDVPNKDWPLLEAAMDLTHDVIDDHLASLQPDLVFFDFAHWIPDLARKHKAKSVFYATSSLARFAYLSSSCGWADHNGLLEDAHTNQNNLYNNNHNNNNNYNDGESDELYARVMHAPPGFPCPEMRLRAGEARVLVGRMDQNYGLSLLERFGISIKQCDAVASKTCREMEGPFCDFLQERLRKPVLLAGPLVPEPAAATLDHQMETWLNGFGEGSVIYCAVGSQYALTKDQFQELLLALQLTGHPFLAVLKPPIGCESIESAMPKGFQERTKGRQGIVQSSWVHQQLVLQHPSVGCFVTHCGSGSLSEAMISNCQIVLLPQAADQFINAKMMSLYLKMGIEVDQRDDEGCFFTKEAVHKAIVTALDVEKGVGKEVKANHARWRKLLLEDGFEESYIDEFIRKLYELIMV